MSLFSFNRENLDEKHLHIVCNLTDEQAILIGKAVEETIIDSLGFKREETIEGVGDCHVYSMSPFEIAQAAAEAINLEITPEIGFYIGTYVFRELNQPEKYTKYVEGME